MIKRLKPTSLALLLAIVFVGLSVPPSADAQDSGVEFAKEYRRPGYPTMTIYVMGSVSQPGVWKFEQEADFFEMMAVLSATGLSSTVQVATKSEVVIRIFRESGNTRTQFYEQDLKDVLQGVQIPPKLQDQDILIVETVTRPTRRITVQSVSSIIAAVSTGVLLFIRLSE